MEEKRSESLALLSAEGERQVRAIQQDYELWSEYLPWWERKAFYFVGWYYMLDRAWIVLAFGVAMIVMAVASFAYDVPPAAGAILGGSGFILGVIALLELLRRK
jgi:hypothetical protein